MKEDDYRFQSAIIRKSKQSFKFFFNTIFSISIEKIEGQFIPGKHFDEWCDRLQNNLFTATLSARLHGKSTVVYGYIAWLLLNIDTLPGLFPEILYLSYKDDLAGVHVKNTKRLIEVNPYFADYKNLTPAETIMEYRKGSKTFTVTPAGIMSFKRGRHTIGVIPDDILQDPQAAKIDLAQLDKVTKIFFEQVASIKKKYGFIHLVGTAQDKTDLFFKLQNNNQYDWKMYKAITSHKKKTSLWPEMFSYQELLKIKNDVGRKAFSKEYQCSPVRSEEMYFKDEEIENITRDLQNVDINKYESDNPTVGGLDIGKKAHPSHLTVYELIPKLDKDGQKTGKVKMEQRLSKFMDNWDYTRQIEYCEQCIKRLGMLRLRFDNTRGEFESFVERNELPPEMEAVVFSTKTKNGMAVDFDKRVNAGIESIELVNDERQTRQICSVDNDLDSPSTKDGHGDAFWSNALACSVVEEGLPSVRWL